MKIRFFAYLREDTKCTETEFAWHPDIRSLLQALSDHYGEGLRRRLFAADGHSLSDEIIIMVNGRHICHLDNMDTRLKDSDIVQIFPPVAGG